VTRWATGAEQIMSMLAAGELEQVAPSPQNAARLLAEAERHLRSAALLAPDDPSGAYDMLYAAARKATAAALAVQGLRSTSKGGHRAVQDAQWYATLLSPFVGPDGGASTARPGDRPCDWQTVSHPSRSRTG